MTVTRRTMLAAGCAAMLADRPARAANPAPAVRSGVVATRGASIAYRDTGGAGPPIVLLHAFTGSLESWEPYQAGALAAAGLRVVTYSRRGFKGSPVVAGSDPGSAIDDLNAVVDAVGVRRFHLLGTAGGGFIVPDYVLSHPERVIGMVLACTQAGCVEPSYRAALDRMVPPEFRNMPATFRELSPAYRALNAEGTARWEALEHASKIGDRIVQPPRHRIDYAALARIRTPALVIAGAADLYIPPALARDYAARIAGSQVVVLADSGHSAYWEQPAAFNRLVIDFVRRHR